MPPSRAAKSRVKFEHMIDGQLCGASRHSARQRLRYLPGWIAGNRPLIGAGASSVTMRCKNDTAADIFSLVAPLAAMAELGWNNPRRSSQDPRFLDASGEPPRRERWGSRASQPPGTLCRILRLGARPYPKWRPQWHIPDCSQSLAWPFCFSRYRPMPKR
jgi:hypothetical protein